MNDLHTSGTSMPVDEDERWRERHERLLRQLQQDEREHAALESVLRRFVQRLCLAAHGLDDGLDRMLDRTSAAIRGDSGAIDLEPLLAELSNAIAHAAPPALLAAHGAAVRHADGDRALRDTLAQIIDRLDLDPALVERAGEVRNRLTAAAGIGGIVEACGSLAELVAAQRERLKLEQADVQRILLQVDSRLHEFVAYLRGEAAERRRAEQSLQQLDDGLLGDVRELTQSVQQATDLDQLRNAVGRKLESVDQHLQQFRARESERVDEYRHRAERMRARVEQLEREARTLQASLQREQINASTDPLTGIPNRLAFDQRIALEFKRWKRFGRPLSIAVWDIDLFKSINDHHGHRTGDRVIRAIGRLLSRQIRDTDFVARYGGEEFVMVFVDTGAADALVAADKIRRALAALKIDGGDATLSLTASCGIAEFRGADDPEQVFERADRAMYAAKQRGRNRCVLDGEGS